MAVDLRASHYRFGIDELAEATHGWHAAEDVNPAQGVIAVNTTFLLRFTVQEIGGTAAANTDQQFQCRKNAGTWQDITTTSSIAKAVVAAAFANGDACTKRLGGTGTFEVSGAGCTEDGLSGGPQNDIAASGNSETECGLQIVGADVAANDVIQFRLTSPDFPITNDVVPALTVAGATIVEADMAATGVGAQSVVGAMVAAGVTAAAGLAAASVVAVAVWAGVASASGSAADALVSGAVAAADGVATGLSTALWTTTNTEAGDVVSVGVATWESQAAAIGATDWSASGVATSDGRAASISGGTGSAAGSATALADGEAILVPTVADLVSCDGVTRRLVSHTHVTARRWTVDGVTRRLVSV